MNDRVLTRRRRAIAKKAGRLPPSRKAITDAHLRIQCKTCGKVFDIYKSITESLNMTTFQGLICGPLRPQAGG